jgi:hypothetical protein
LPEIVKLHQENLFLTAIWNQYSAEAETKALLFIVGDEVHAWFYYNEITGIKNYYYFPEKIMKSHQVNLFLTSFSPL